MAPGKFHLTKQNTPLRILYGAKLSGQFRRYRFNNRGPATVGLKNTYIVFPPDQSIDVDISGEVIELDLVPNSGDHAEGEFEFLGFGNS